MKFIIEVCKGVLIGAGCILPGISSGVLCVIFGIYEKLIDSILNFFTDIRKNFKFLFPLAIGGGIGVILFSNILQFFLHKFPMQTKSIFIGLILGGVFMLFKQSKLKQNLKLRNVLCLFISLIMGIAMVYVEEKIGIDTTENVNFVYLVFSGFLMSIGIVVPGVSNTIILMLLGVYSLYLSSVSSLYLPILIPMGIGLILGSFIFMKIIKFLLDKFYIQTMFSIIGFTLGSILVLMPQMQSLIDIVLSVLWVLFGTYLINLFPDY